MTDNEQLPHGIGLWTENELPIEPDLSRGAGLFM